MKRFMEFVDEVLHDFQGQLTKDDIYHMTYKEIGYMRDHRKKNYPPEAESIARALMGPVNSKGGKGKMPSSQSAIAQMMKQGQRQGSRGRSSSRSSSRSTPRASRGSGSYRPVNIRR